jgi:hypothetical protein
MLNSQLYLREVGRDGMVCHHGSHRGQIIVVWYCFDFGITKCGFYSQFIKLKIFFSYF